MSLKPKLRSWQFPRYWRFNKRYHGGYQLICLISRPKLIASRCDWYLSKGLFKGFLQPLRPWESSKNWWRYGQMKFVTQRPCSKSRKRKNYLSIKLEKRQKQQKGKNWKKRHGEKRRKSCGGEKKSAREIWLIASRLIMSPPWSSNIGKIGRRSFCCLQLLPTRK